MTFDEAVTLIGNNEPLNAILVILGEGTLTVNRVGFAGSKIIISPSSGRELLWTSEGISVNSAEPS